MNTPQESSHTENYKTLLDKNVASGMNRDMADIESRRALGLKMTERDKAYLAKAGINIPEEQVQNERDLAEQTRENIMIATEAEERLDMIARGEGDKIERDKKDGETEYMRKFLATKDSKTTTPTVENKTTPSTTEAIAVAETIPRGLTLDADHISDILVQTFGTDVQLSDSELELLARDYKENQNAIKTSGEWPELTTALLRTQDEKRISIPNLDAKTDKLIDALRAA